jgi:hypothetical protein
MQDLHTELIMAKFDKFPGDRDQSHESDDDEKILPKTLMEHIDSGKSPHEPDDESNIHNATDKMKGGIITEESDVASEKGVASVIGDEDRPPAAQYPPCQKDDGRYKDDYAELSNILIRFGGFHTLLISPFSRNDN